MWLEIFNFIHFVGLIWGVGGATFANIISAKSEKNPSLMQILPSISKLIWIGLILLIISGIALPYFITWPLNKSNLIIKHVLVVWIVIFGVIISVKSRKMKKLGELKNKQNRLLKVRKQLKIFSIINLILWYLITLLSVFV